MQKLSETTRNAKTIGNDTTRHETPSEDDLRTSFVISSQSFPKTNKSLILCVVEDSFYKELKHLISEDRSGFVFFNKGVNKIIIHAAEVILPGYHEFSIDLKQPRISYVRPAQTLIRIDKKNAKKGDRVLIVGPKHNNRIGKFVSYGGNSVVVQLDDGERFSPAPNSVRLIEPQKRMDTVKKTISFDTDETATTNNAIQGGEYDKNPIGFTDIAHFVPVKGDPTVPKTPSPMAPIADHTTNLDFADQVAPSTTTSGKVKPTVYATPDASNVSVTAPVPPLAALTSIIADTDDESSHTEDYSDVDIGDISNIPDGNYDVDSRRFRVLTKYKDVWISDNLTQDVYQQMMQSKKLFIHIDARKFPEKVGTTNWIARANAYMGRRGYVDPRAGYLISPRSNHYYELWECNGGFDFMRFKRSMRRKNEGVKYGHKIHLSIVLDNTWYYVVIFM